LNASTTWRLDPYHSVRSWYALKAFTSLDRFILLTQMLTGHCACACGVRVARSQYAPKAVETVSMFAVMLVVVLYHRSPTDAMPADLITAACHHLQVGDGALRKDGSTPMWPPASYLTQPCSPRISPSTCRGMRHVPAQPPGV
jgi:hypothetical protein